MKEKLVYMFGRKKKKRIAELEDELKEIKVAFSEQCNELFMLGDNMKRMVFIPEYFGFEETEVRDEDNIIEGRIYHLDGVNIMRPFDEDCWYLMSVDKKLKAKVFIKNMLAGAMIFEAIGMDISVEKYQIESLEDSEKILPELDI